MHKNNFCTIPSKALNYEDSIIMSQSTIYKNNDKDLKHNKNIKKLKKSFYNNDFKCKQYNTLELNIGFLFNKNYILSQKILAKYNSPKLSNLGLFTINNIIQNKKCNICTIYNDIIIFSNGKVEYIKKYYKYCESIKIIPKREIYFKHLMQFIERPIFRNFTYNKISRKIGLDKLSIYRRINYPKKFNKKIYNNKILSDNIIFNHDVIETIENCSTFITQSSNKDQNIDKKDKNNNIKCEKKGNNFENESSLISEIKFNNCNNKKNDNNISCIDNSLLNIMKDLSISQNKINEYLKKNNSKYKNLYLKIKNKKKSTTHNTLSKKNYPKNKNDFKEIKEKEPKFLEENEKNIINNKKVTRTKEINNRDFYKKVLIKKQSSNLEKYHEQKNTIGHDRNRKSISIGKKSNNIKVIPFNSNTINSQIVKNASCNTNFNNKYCLSSLIRNKTSTIHNLKKKYNTNKKLFNKENNLHNYFNYSSKEKNKDINFVNFLKNNKLMCDLNNKEILRKIKKIIEIKKPKNNSMKKDINTQKFLTESPMWMLDLNSLNENEAKKKYQTINAVKSISISNNQFFNSKSEFKKYDEK
jgi:hypothetical protein